jgi:hypothetical protein
MSPESDFDNRLRVGLSRAADVVDPAVGLRLTEATVRGRRRRATQRAAIVLAAIAVATVSVVALLGPPSPVTPSRLSRADLIGTWSTPSVPASEWIASYERAGGSADAARAFLGPPMGGTAAEYRIELRVTDNEWALFVSAGGAALLAGWHGPYDFDGTVVRARDSTGSCEASYDVESVGDGIRIRVVADWCGGTDLLAQRTIYETAPFHRMPAPSR